MLALPVRLGALRGLMKEVSAGGGKPLVVGGARELAGVLRRELGRDAKAGAVRADDAPEDGGELARPADYERPRERLRHLFHEAPDGADADGKRDN